jgi:hypothetical protein
LHPFPAAVCLGLLLIFLLPSTEAWGKATTASQARRAVEAWLRLDPHPLGALLGQEVGEIQSFPPDASEPSYYIVNLNPSGFVVMPGDDLVEPVIAFGPGAAMILRPIIPWGRW